MSAAASGRGDAVERGRAPAEAGLDRGAVRRNRDARPDPALRGALGGSLLGRIDPALRVAGVVTASALLIGLCWALVAQVVGVVSR